MKLYRQQHEKPPHESSTPTLHVQLHFINCQTEKKSFIFTVSYVVLWSLFIWLLHKWLIFLLWNSKTHPIFSMNDWALKQTYLVRTVLAIKPHNNLTEHSRRGNEMKWIIEKRGKNTLKWLFKIWNGENSRVESYKVVLLVLELIQYRLKRFLEGREWTWRENGEVNRILMG